MVKIKICGIRDLVTAELLSELRVDFVGFVFAPSPRQITAEEANKITQMLPKEVKRVGVFVNEKKSVVEQLIDECGLDVIQLHGNESIEYCQEFKKCQVIKAFKVKDRESLKEVNRYPVDFVLLDRFALNAEGGTGRTFNWDLVKNQSFHHPVILAGGINISNVKEAIEKVNPYAIDVSSGVETNGIKNPAKIRQFVEIVRGVNYVAK